jgi:hypothetical protein
LFTIRKYIENGIIVVEKRGYVPLSCVSKDCFSQVFNVDGSIFTRILGGDPCKGCDSTICEEVSTLQPKSKGTKE